LLGQAEDLGSPNHIESLTPAQGHILNNERHCRRLGGIFSFGARVSLATFWLAGWWQWLAKRENQ